MQTKKTRKLSIVIPTYNEEMNVIPISEALVSMLENDLPEYDYEIIFIDNCSKDGTQALLSEICEKNKRIKAIFNAKNFGGNNSSFYGLLQSSGDCTILTVADFQEPIDMIPVFVKEWEKGTKIVIGIKTSSKENRFMRFIRTCYYKAIKKLSDVEQIEHFMGFGLYDKTFISILQNLNDSMPFLRGLVAELGFKRKEIPYQQQQRRAGKSKYNLYRLYDLAMISFTSYTKIGLRLATMLGFFVSVISVIIALVYFVLKLINWDAFPTGNAPILIGVFVLGGLQIFFIGLVGEYILSINNRVMNRPLVIEEERINFGS
ncbi:MAG: glycosyltransferase family 2 protein [Spirochaetaceae bacterium]|jgi:glycosyltransferase involved in cell wall biosynthesis|nr:glycosyltransferase family 2 protein [Spirochaetaceae bacterium]